MGNLPKTPFEKILFSQKKTLLIASILGFLAVAIGAFGAHALKAHLLLIGKIEVFETASKYHFYHSFLFLLIGILQFNMKTKWLSYASYAIFFGILFFSGSLYALALTGVGLLGAVAPIGGVFLLIGWFLIGKSVYEELSEL